MLQPPVFKVKAASAYGRQSYHLHVPIVLKSGSLNFLEPSGPARPVLGLLFIMTPVAARNLQTADKSKFHCSTWSRCHAVEQRQCCMCGLAHMHTVR